MKKFIFPTVIFLFFLFLYVHNVSHSTYGGDVGDLVTAAAVGGVAHPPGYPLFTLFGFLLTRIFFLSSSPAFAVGLISAFCGAGGIVCFYFISSLLTKNKPVSLLSACVLGFCFPYWFYSEIAEVFALNAFFALALFLLAFVYRQTKKPVVAFLFFICLGLSLTNHQTILLLIPSLVLLIVPTVFASVRKHPLFLLFSSFSFLLGLLSYAYVWVASAHNPIINWDNVHDWQSFLHLILRKDYGTLQAGIFPYVSLAQRFVTMQLFFQYLLFQLTIPVIFFCLIGFWKLFKTQKAVFFSLGLAFLLSGPLFLTYAGFPLTSAFVFGTYERFIVMPLCIFLIPVGLGIQVFVNFLAKLLPRRNYAVLFQSIFFFIPLMLFIYNFPKTDLSHFYLGDTYAEDYLTTLPKNAILIVTGDTETFNLWYVHFVLHVRPDVDIYNIGAAPYKDSLIMPRLTGIPQSKQGDYLVGVLQKLQHTYPVFSAVKMQPKNGKKITWMPLGLSFEMLEDNQIPSQEDYKKLTALAWTKLHPPTPEDLQKDVFHNLSITEVPLYYADALANAGVFAYSTYKDSDTAFSYYKKAKAVAPDNPRVYGDEAVVYMGIAGKCKESATDLSKAITLDPLGESSYFLLYNISLSCFKQKNAAQEVSQEYSRIFQKDFQKEYKKSGLNKPIYE